MPALRRVDPSSPGFTRRRHARGFFYEDARGTRVDDPEVLERIRALAVPPAWTDVWICPVPQGHLQAVGVDAAGRRQYLYHPAWRERQDTMKFRRIESFAESLPTMRVDIERDLALDGVPKERVMAAAVRLLDRATFRVGSEAYAQQNGSFGLATIRKGHVTIDGTLLVFDYTAKAGIRRVHSIDDPLLVPLVGQLKRRRTGGAELLAYREGARWRDVRSADINAYLKDLLGEEHTAKDFRTWHATVLAALDLAAQPRAEGVSSRKRQVATTVRHVAEHLGNTPAVARSSYIDPRVFDRFHEGLTIASVLEDIDRASPDAARETIEGAVLALVAGDASDALAA